MTILLTTGIWAQDKADSKSPLRSFMSNENIFSHMDVGVNVGTTGLGVDIAVPVGNYVRLRVGYNYMPRISINTDFNIETSNGSIGKLAEKVGKIDEKLAEFHIDINHPDFEEYKAMLDKFSKVERKDYVTMALKPNLHQFKFMVDVLPFRNNKHWSFTAGFFVGPSTVGYAESLENEALMLEGINAYNDIYVKYPQHGIHGNYLRENDDATTDLFFKYGMAGFNLGSFADGDKAIMVPENDNTVRGEMTMSKVRPYLGFGYNTYMSKDKKWKFNFDAGIMFLCGAPRIYVDNVYKIDTREFKVHCDFNKDPDQDVWVWESGIGTDDDGNYYGDIVRYNPNTWEYDDMSESLRNNHVDIVHDLHDTPGKVGRTINTISKFKVYPNISVGISYRLF